MRLPLRVLFVSLLASVVVAAGASAQADLFSGTWTATDLNGSNETITFTLQADGTYRVEFHEDRTHVCGGPGVRATGSATAKGNTLTGTLDDIQCESGTSPITSAPITFDFDPGSGTLLGLEVVWRRAQAEVLTVADAAVRVAWRESRANGSVVVSGSVSAPSELAVTLAREGATGRVVARTSVSAPAAGPFTATAKLPLTLVPGTYVLHVGGTSAGLEIQPADRRLVVPAPLEGVVDRAWISMRPGGRPAGTLTGPQKEL